MDLAILNANYSAKKITREEYCHYHAALQGFNDTLKVTATAAGIQATYRGRTATMSNDCLTWNDKGTVKTAGSFKEMKIKIDIDEKRAREWIRSF